MFGELLSRETGWKAAPFLALLAAVVWPFVCTDSSFSPTSFAAICAVLAVVGGLHPRATLFEAALPIPGRQLVATRLLVAFAQLWPPALVMTGETFWLRGWKDALPLLAMAAAFSLTVVMVQSFRISQASLPSWIAYTPMLAWLGLRPVLDRPFSHWGAVLGISFATGAALLARLWMSVPEGFEIAPAEARPARRFAWRRPSSRRVWFPVWWPAWRSFCNLETCLSLAFVVLVAQSGMLLLIAAFLVSIPLAACRRLEWLLVLPVSRRRLLLMMVLPGLCILLADTSLPRHLQPPMEAPMVSTGYSGTRPDDKAAGEETPNVLVPATFWRWAGRGVNPAIESPWGEKTAPWTLHRLGMTFYNPYSVGPNNSAPFVEWQFARATEAVYGRSVPLSKAAELQRIPIPRQIRTQFVAALAATLLFLGLLRLTFWSRTTRRVGWTLIIWLCVSLPFFIDPFTTGPSAWLSDVITIVLAAVLPQNWAALIGLAALLVGSFYLAAERQFMKMDLIPKLRPAKGQE
jgi:hypothetical protein